MEATQADTQEDNAARATQESTEESKRAIEVFTEQIEMKLFEFITDKELQYNKRLMDYKNPNKRETPRDKFCAEGKMYRAVGSGSRAIAKCMAHMKLG